MTIPISSLLLFSYSMIIFINATLIIVVVIVVFSFCVGCLVCVYFCVLCFV
jgi:Pyruvate/2-oxoacid:ferredoxin oxidoreductase delta subunit